MAMNWYYWDTNIGRAVACAASVKAAREQALATLAADDVSRPDLARALKVAPKVIRDQPFAVMAWQQ